MYTKISHYFMPIYTRAIPRWNVIGSSSTHWHKFSLSDENKRVTFSEMGGGGGEWIQMKICRKYRPYFVANLEGNMDYLYVSNIHG